MTDSPAMRLARLAPADRDMVLGGLTEAQVAVLLNDWEFWARPEQLEPLVAWLIWLIETGRGWGKTTTAARTTHKKVNAGHVKYGALLHRTSADIRDIMIEGETGLLATASDGKMPNYEPSKRRLTWPNGAQFTLYSAEEPDQLRGPTIDFGWADEFATYKGITGIDGLSAFDNLLFARRGTNNPAGPQLILTTTPKRVRAMKTIHEMIGNPVYKIFHTRGSLRDNIANLDPGYVAGIMAKYAGTPLGEQEIEGRLAKTVEGAIFTELGFAASRILSLDDLPELSRAVVAVDPSSGDGSGDECGITVQALSAGTMPTELTQGALTVVRNVRHGYLLEDASLAAPPDGWADKVCEVAAKWDAVQVVAEGNQGGQMVASLLKARNPSLRVKVVHARVGKAPRAQPVAGLFSQRRWHLVGEFPDLEDQSTTWVPGKDKDSPDRMDAMVWGATYLEKSLAHDTSHQNTSTAWLSASVG